MPIFQVEPHTLYEIECWRDGKLIWTEIFPNLVTNVGRNELLDACFKTGKGTNAWYVGLVNNASFSAYAAADSMSSHAGWIEGVPYSNATRVNYTPSATTSQSMDNNSAKAIFTINATLTVRGAFLVDNSTKSGSTGILYGVGDFTVARSVISGDTLNVKITLTD